MSEAETSNPKPFHDGYTVGIIVAIILIVGTVVYFQLYPSEETGTSPFEPIEVTGKCGEGTHYHPLTNKCETFRPLEPFREVNPEVIDELDRVIRDIQLDTDGERIVHFDENGIPIVSCSPYENEHYSIDEKCQMTLK